MAVDIVLVKSIPRYTRLTVANKLWRLKYTGSLRKPHEINGKCLLAFRDSSYVPDCIMKNQQSYVSYQFMNLLCSSVDELPATLIS